VIACYLELYEEYEAEHINGPTHPDPTKTIGLANSKVEGAKAWWLFIECFLRMR